MKTFVRLALILTLFVPFIAHADEASRRAKAEHMMELTHADRLVKQTMDNMSAQITNMAKEMGEKQGMNAEQSALFTEYMQHIHQITEEAVGWEQIKPMVIKVYVDNFTDEDLDGIIKFYESPAGQSFINKMPKVMPEMMQLVMERVKDVQPKIAAEAKAFAEKMKATTPTADGNK